MRFFIHKDKTQFKNTAAMVRQDCGTWIHVDINGDMMVIRGKNASAFDHYAKITKDDACLPSDYGVWVEITNKQAYQRVTLGCPPAELFG